MNLNDFVIIFRGKSSGIKTFDTFILDLIELAETKRLNEVKLANQNRESNQLKDY